METVRASVICIFASGLLGALALILIPGRKNNMIMKSTVSIFIVLSMLEPIKNVLDGFSDLPVVEQTVGVYSAALPETASGYFKEEISGIITSEAKEKEIEIISVEAEISEEENCIIIQKIIVVTNEKNMKKLKEFEQSVSRKAGVEITAEAK